MSQDYNLPAGSTTVRDNLLYNSANSLEALRSSFSGANAPTNPSPVAGQLYWDSPNNQLKLFDGTAWNALLHGTFQWVDASNYADLNTAVANAANKTLLIITQVNVTANLTIPANVGLLFFYPGVVSHSTYTISISGSNNISSCLWQVFNGTGAVTVSPETVDGRYIKADFLINPYFDFWSYGTDFTNPTNTTQVANSWYGTLNGASYSVAKYTGYKKYSNQSCRINVLNLPTTAWCGITQSVDTRALPIFQGRSIVLSTVLKASTNLLKVRIAIDDGVTSTVKQTTITTGWTTEKITHVFNSSATKFTVEIGVDATSSATGTLYVDSVFSYWSYLDSNDLRPDYRNKKLEAFSTGMYGLGSSESANVSDYSSLSAAITAIGSTQTTLVISTTINASNIAEAVTVPTTLSLMPMRGGMINKGSAISLTINSAPVGNPMFQWLSGFEVGEVIITSVSEMSAIWVGSGVAGINLAIDTSDGVISLKPGITSIDSVAIALDQSNVRLKGAGVDATNLQKSTDGITRAIYCTAVYQGISDLTVDCNSKTLDGIVLTTANFGEYRNLLVKNVGGTGIGFLVSDASVNDFYSVRVRDCANNMEVRGTGASNHLNFYATILSNDVGSGTLLKIYSASNVVQSVWYHGIIINPYTGQAVSVTNAADSGIRSLYLEASYLNTVDLIHITGPNTINYVIDGGIIAQTHASFAQNIVTIDGGAVNVSLKNLYFQKTSNNTTPMINIDDVTGVKLENLTTYVTTAHNILTTSANSVSVICENIRASGQAGTVDLAGTGHKWTGGTANITITIVNGASNIIIENFPGNITVQANTTGIELVNCTGTVTDGSGLATQRKNGTYITPWRAVASATELVLGDGEQFVVSGTTSITSIASADSIQGRKITLIFEGILTFTDGNNLKLAGNFVTTTDNTIYLSCLGGYWFEVSRSVN